MRQFLLIAFLLQCTYSFAQPRVSVYAGYQIDSRYRGDGGPATTSVQTTSALLHSATNIALDSANNLACALGLTWNPIIMASEAEANNTSDS